jgi:dTDP-4-amino-4,6-dideoxygalactose transaminase
MSIQLFVPTFDIDECIAEIRECLEKGWTGLGFKTIEIENAWREYTGLPHAHFVNSNTSGLHLGLDIFKAAGGWEDGDEVITTPLTFVASNHVILYERLKPVFADVDKYLCIDPDDLERKITPRTRAVMFVGLGGNTGQLSAVQALCRQRGLRLILDAAHMSGTRLAGVTPRADCVVYSFQSVKNLGTADSGMVCFADAADDAICRKKSWMGISKDTFTRTIGEGSYQWRYDVEHVGYKYSGNSIMAALALVQLRRLERDNAYRRQICAWYDEGFAGNAAIGRVPMAPGCEPSRHLYQIHVDHRDELMLALNASDIFPGVHYRDNRAYSMYAREIDDCPNATRMSERIISLPLHMRMTEEDVAKVVAAVNQHAR